MLIDSHCHLDRLEPAGQTVQSHLETARARDISGFLCIDIDFDNFEEVHQIACANHDVWCTAGVHPLADLHGLVGDNQETTYQRLKTCAQRSSKVVAIGECGLDYHYQPELAEAQQELFELQLRLACELDKPVIVHTREAREDTLRLLEKYTAQGLRGVLHCFTESLEMAQAAVELGFYISFSGILTFRNADSLRATAKALPDDKILVETDSPYLAPVPHRGKTNVPAYVVEVAEKVAEVRGTDLESIAKITTQNFADLFRLTLPVIEH